MVMFTVAEVELDTVTVFTVMPAPKNAVVVPCTKCVDDPVTTTFSVWAKAPDEGARVTIVGVVFVSVKTAGFVTPLTLAVT
jgi:hypothetical protein